MISNLTESRIVTFIESNEGFCVEFDDAWQWVGYSRKDVAKDMLTSNFVKGVEFSSQTRKSPQGGRPSEFILLTVDCFKAFALMAGTEQGKLVRKHFIECEKKLKQLQSQPKNAITHYTDRVMDIDKHLKKPSGTWCVIEHCGHLLLKVERMGYPVGRYDLLDGSVGAMWAKRRKELGITTEILTASYRVPQAPFPIKINAFPYDELGLFRSWLETEYEASHFVGYLQEKYGEIVKV